MLVRNGLNIQRRLLFVCFVTLFFVACSDAGNNATEAGEEKVKIDASESASASVVNVIVGQSVELTRGDTSVFGATDINSVLVIQIQWTIISKPTNSKATIENPDSATPVFRPDIVGEYVLRVVISQAGEVLADKEIKIVAGVNDVFPVKPANHLPTTDLCTTCHIEGTWVISGVDHTQVLGTCVGCHDGVLATGKSATHIVSSDVCEVCHRTDAWVTTPFDHSIVIGACVSCHNGIDASGKPVNHPNTTNMCEACHSVFPAQWIPVLLPLDHNQTLGTCVSCHNGMVASGKSSTHIASDDVCEVCHSVPPSTWLGLITNIPPDHTGFIGNCITCHDGITASGKGLVHITSTNSCDACHQPGPAPWTPVAASAVDHAEVIGVCSSCHNGIVATGKGINHVVTTRECDVCHTTQVWLSTTGAGPGVLP